MSFKLSFKEIKQMIEDSKKELFKKEKKDGETFDDGSCSGEMFETDYDVNTVVKFESIITSKLLDKAAEMMENAEKKSEEKKEEKAEPKKVEENISEVKGKEENKDGDVKNGK